MARALVYVVPFALALYALIDLSRSEPAERADLPAWGWVAVVVLVPVIGPVIWLVVSRSRRGPSDRRPRPAPTAPDDDPDFLRGLDPHHPPTDPPHSR